MFSSYKTLLKMYLATKWKINVDVDWCCQLKKANCMLGVNTQLLGTKMFLNCKHNVFASEYYATRIKYMYHVCTT